MPGGKQGRPLADECRICYWRRRLDKKFVAEAKAEGLVNLGGHRSIGGMRASIYNAMPMEGVDKLLEFMKKFAAENK